MLMGDQGRLYARIQDQQNFKIKRSFCSKDFLGPKKFTVGFGSKIKKNEMGANVASYSYQC
jgi:hypothetical protein